MSNLSDLLEMNQLGEPIASDLNFYMGMPCAIISMVNDANSTVAARKVINSIHKTESELIPFIIAATTPDRLDYDLNKFKLSTQNWTYPVTPGLVKNDLKSGLQLTGYNAKNVKKVISCMVSHMRIWHISFIMQVPLVVLEHDVLFTKQLKISDFPVIDAGIIGLNDPRGATRKSSVYYNKLLEQKDPNTEFPHIKPVPWVDDDKLAPQGLAGNSAYIIYPKAAKHMLDLVSEYGMWPNDALMCKQLVPFLSQAFPFYTTLQGIASTTQG